MMMKRKLKNLYNIKTMYRDYCKDNDWNMKEPLWNKYVHLIADVIRRYIIEGGYLQLPYGLGSLFIIKNKINYFFTDKNGNKHLRFKFINWKETIKLREKKEPGKSREYWTKKENRDKYLVTFDNHKTNDTMYVVSYRFDELRDVRKTIPMLYYYFRPFPSFRKEITQFLLNKTNKIPTYYDRFSNGHFNYGTFSKKVATNAEYRRRKGYRKYMERLEIDRCKTN